MDRRFSNATSSLASAALKLCTELANYWRAVLAERGEPLSPRAALYARPWPEVARGPGPSAQYAIRELVRAYRSGWRREPWDCSSGSREGSPRTTTLLTSTREGDGCTGSSTRSPAAGTSSRPIHSPEGKLARPVRWQN